MHPDLWIVISVISASIAVGGKLFKAVQGFMQRWDEKVKEIAPTDAESRAEPERLLPPFIVVSGIAFGALLLLAITVQQTAPPSPVITLLACAVGILVVSGLLLLVLGVPAYNTIMSVAERLKVVEGQIPKPKGSPGSRVPRRKPFTTLRRPKKTEQGNRLIEPPKTEANGLDSTSPESEKPPSAIPVNRSKGRKAEKKKS